MVVLSPVETAELPGLVAGWSVLSVSLEPSDIRSVGLLQDLAYRVLLEESCQDVVTKQACRVLVTSEAGGTETASQKVCGDRAWERPVLEGTWGHCVGTCPG